MKFWTIIGNGVLAGIAAGLVLAILILAFSTPLILQAEKYEHQASGDHEHGSTHASNQRNLGTLIGTLIVSIIYGLLLSLVYGLKPVFLKDKPIIRGLIYGIAGFLLIVLIPSLAFPLNPPGVESVESPATRQAWWFSVIIAEVAGIFSFFLIRRLISQKYFAIGSFAGFFSMALLISIPFIIGPPSAIKESVVPSELLHDYRLVNLAILFTFWTTLGLILSLQNLVVQSKMGKQA